MVIRTANYEQLAMRFVELLNDRATRSGQTVSRWTVMASTPLALVDAAPGSQRAPLLKRKTYPNRRFPWRERDETPDAGRLASAWSPRVEQQRLVMRQIPT
jgi:hypothetical protein